MYRVCQPLAAHRLPPSIALITLRRFSALNHGSLQRWHVVAPRSSVLDTNTQIPTRILHLQHRTLTLLRAVAECEQARDSRDDHENETSGSDEHSAHPQSNANAHKPESPSQGFWSLEKYHDTEIPYSSDFDLETIDTSTTSMDKESTDARELEPSDLHLMTSSFDELWSGSIRRHKRDLSHWSTIGKERKVSIPDTAVYHPHAFTAAQRNSRDRRVTKLFMQHFYEHTSAEHGIPDQEGQDLLTMLQQDYGEHALECSGDILTWSWILLAKRSYAVKRLLLVCDLREKSNQPPVPLWIFLQILRAPVIDATSLKDLVTFLEERTPHWTWEGDEVIILITRLLRHARLVASVCFDQITSLFLELLDLRFPDNLHNDFKICTIWCNRVLTLLSMTSSEHPFRWMTHQQTGQLAIIKYMQDHKPQIPIMREGFRAIAKLQMMHAKTEDEEEWARAKALTWPPWEERHQMGALSQPRQYPGKSSRVTKVMKRMREAGYAPYDFDLAMQILAGWDTDWSPTIQVTRPSSLIPTPSLWEVDLSKTSSLESALIWSARVEATRTVREAWMCFCSFASAVPKSAQSVYVYRAMFRKLLAKSNRQIVEGGPLPGDGTETYLDPELARDQVYIPEEIPSVEGLFSKMIKNDVKPDTALLTGLLSVENDLERGLRYVSSGNIDSWKKSILQTPQKQTPEELARALRGLPKSFVSAYVQLMARPNALKTEKKPQFSGNNDRTWSGAAFAKAILTAASCHDVSVWNRYFFALFRHTHGDEAVRHRLYISNVWHLTCDALDQLWTTVPLNFGTLKRIGSLAFTVLTHGGQYDIARHPVAVMKRLFMVAAYGDSSQAKRKFCDYSNAESMLQFVPDGDSIETTVWVLGAAQRDTSMHDIVRLLRWTHHHRKTMVSNGEKTSRHNLAAFRIFFDGLWAEQESLDSSQASDLTKSQRQEVKRLMTDIGELPDKEYLQRYLDLNRARVQRLRNIAKERSQASP